MFWLCVRGARGRFGGLGPVPGVVFSPSPPSRPACPALCAAGCPVRVSLALARWYAISFGLCVPRARSGYPLWVFNADLFVEYDTAGVVPKWLFDVMMLGKDVIFYGEADVVHRIGRDIQRLWRMQKDKDPTTVPFYHVPLPVYSWLSGLVTSSTYQFDEHCMWIGTTSCWDKQVYLLLSPVTMPSCARGLAHCCACCSSLYITFTVSELCVVFRWTFRRDAEQEPW